MNLFLANRIDLEAGFLEVAGEEHHHLTRVLRRQAGDVVFVADGDGRRYRCTVETVDLALTRCHIDDCEMEEARTGLVLVPSILKNPAKLDWIVEKAVELGVDEIRPCITERTLGRQGKTERLNAIALAAMKQSLRCRLPKVYEAGSMQEILTACDEARILCFHESASEPLSGRLVDQLREAHLKLSIWIGPEGGFSEEEVSLLQGQGGKVLSLGPRRLRSETAAITALARLTMGDHDVL